MGVVVVDGVTENEKGEGVQEEPPISAVGGVGEGVVVEGVVGVGVEVMRVVVGKEIEEKIE